jgi:putative DNA primase/helicase
MTDDCERLSARCGHVSAVFVVVDPLVSYLGSRKGRTLNTNNDLEVRKALAPLKELAERLGAAVVAIRHYRKGAATDAMEAGGGSVGFAALVRVILAALPDPDDDSRYLLAVAKNNLVAKSERPAIRYQIVPADSDSTIGRISWGERVEMSAGEILHAQADADKEPTGKVAEAMAFLKNHLASGDWMLSTEIMKDADQHGLSKPAVMRARVRLPDINIEKRGKHWYWRLESAGEANARGEGGGRSQEENQSNLLM